MVKKDVRSALIRAAAAYARKVEGPITLAALVRDAGVRACEVYASFDGGIRGLLVAAGLEGRVGRVKKAELSVLLEELHRVARKLGRVPSQGQLSRMARFSGQTYYQRFGRYAAVMRAYERWLRGRKGTTKFLKGAREEGARMRAWGSYGAGADKAIAPHFHMGTLPHQAGRVRTGRVAHRNHADEWVRTGELVGAPQGFRGLVHAPVTESGVVHLFGLLGPELGIAVEKIGTAYPDCLALREQPRTNGKWRRVRIEFELFASHFKEHRHDPGKCDIIVCWENDWKGCPLEVIELKKEMARVMGGAAGK